MSNTVTLTGLSPADAFTSQRLIHAGEIRFSEIISALSVALDITQGHPQGHSMRTALIGMRIAEEIDISAEDKFALFYALLLKDLGCSSNAAKMSYLFGADDRKLKHSARMIDWTKPTECLKHCWQNCAEGASSVDRLVKIASLMTMKKSTVSGIAQIRCDRGAEIASMLQLPEATATAIRHLDEHWDGRGNPTGIQSQEISILGRICCLAQTVEVYYSEFGVSSALESARQRSGKWFDPELVKVVLSLSHDSKFWNGLSSDDLIAELRSHEPYDRVLLADEECIDRVAQAFAMVVDAKSPWTYQHSTRVADIAVGTAAEMGCTPTVQRDIRRAALLHDIGKLGVSNRILDKPGKPTADEFRQIRKHTEYTKRILDQVDAFRTLSHVASAHHERLDGGGYHRGLHEPEIPTIARILVVSDICEAMTAKRPYRDAMSWEQVREIMCRDAGKGLDPECMRALASWYDHAQLQSRVEQQMTQVDALLSQLG